MKFAINPLQLFAREDGSLAPLSDARIDETLGLVAASGFSAMKVDLATLDIQAHLAAFQRHGVQPAPGYFHAQFEHEPQAQIEQRFTHALALSRQCGLHDIVVACSVTPEGRDHLRAVDALPDQARVIHVAASVGRLGRIARNHDIRLCFHQHVGTAIETFAETSILIEATDPHEVWLCPDTGHLAWGGCDDLPAFFSRQRHRIAMVHIKDLDRRTLTIGRTHRWNYGAFVRAGLWREPGHGDLALGPLLQSWRGIDGWAVIEVDRAAAASSRESLALCSAFAAGFSMLPSEPRIPHL